MALKAFVENLDEVDDALRGYYEESEGGYTLSVEGVDNHPEVASLKNAYEKEKEKRRKAAEERDKYKSTAEELPEDFDPEEWRRLKDNDIGNVDDKLEEQRKRIEERYRKEVEKRDEEVKKRDQRINDLVARDGLRKAMDEAGIAEPYKPAVEAMYRDKVSVEEDGDTLAAFIDGQPVPEALKDFTNSETGKYYVASSGNDGGGAPGGKNTSGGKKWSDMSEQEMVDLWNKNPEEYRRLRDQEKQE